VTCREFADFIADYFADGLDAETRARFNRHIAQCANCRVYLLNYQTTGAIGRRAFHADDDRLPDDVPRELIASVLSARGRHTA
jgi:anti-sigma factor RsiW